MLLCPVLVKLTYTGKLRFTSFFFFFSVAPPLSPQNQDLQKQAAHALAICALNMCHWSFWSFSKLAENDSDQSFAWWNWKSEDDQISSVKATSRVCPNGFFHVARPTQSMFTHFITSCSGYCLSGFQEFHYTNTMHFAKHATTCCAGTALPSSPILKPFTSLQFIIESPDPSRRCWLGLVCSVGWELGQPASHMRRLLPKYRNLITLERVIKSSQPWHYAVSH